MPFAVKIINKLWRNLIYLTPIYIYCEQWACVGCPSPLTPLLSSGFRLFEDDDDGNDDDDDDEGNDYDDDYDDAYSNIVSYTVRRTQPQWMDAKLRMHAQFLLICSSIRRPPPAWSNMQWMLRHFLFFHVPSSFFNKTQLLMAFTPTQ